MKKAIIYVIPLFLIFSLSCRKQDSTIVSPEDSYELGKKGGNTKPVEYEVRFTVPSGVEDKSAYLKTIDPYFGDADSKFFSVFFHGEFRRSDAVMVVPVDGGMSTGVELFYDPNLIVTTNNNNEITSIRLYIKSGSKEDGGIMYKTDQIFITPVLGDPAGFTLSIGNWFTIYECSNFKGGKILGPIGKIYIDDIVYSVPQN